MRSLPKEFRLSNGARMPSIGFGTWKLHEPQLSAVLKEAMACGYDHIDTASVYENEQEIGALLPTFKPSLFLTTKLWCTEYRDPRGALEASLARLGVKSVDLYLMHWPFALKRKGPNSSERDAQGRVIVDHSVDVIKAYHEMIPLVEAGLTKAIGVCNFNLPRMQQLMASNPRIKPAVLQIELHPLLPQWELVKFCQDHGILVQAYSPLGSGSTVMEHPTIKKVAEQEGLTIAQVCLAWALQRGTVPLPKTATLSRVKENIDLKPLSEESMQLISGITDRQRVLDSTSWTTTDCFEDD